MENKTLFLVVGASGTGKTTLVSQLENLHNLSPIPSYTTRPPRSDSEYGHIFVNDEAFAQLKNIVAYTLYNGYQYGATSEQVDIHDLYVIDPSGVDFFKKAYRGKKQIKVIYIKSPIHTREQRMLERDSNYQSAIEKSDIGKAIQIYNTIMERIINDFSEFMNFEKEADFIVENNDDTRFSDIINSVWQFIRKERGDD